MKNKIENIKLYIFYLIIIIITIYIFYNVFKKYKNNILFHEYILYKNNIINKINNTLFSKNENFENNNFKNNKSKNNNFENNKYEINVDYTYYKSNKYDNFDFLNRFLELNNSIEHMENQNSSSPPSIDTLFPDLKKDAFGLKEGQKMEDLLISEEYPKDFVKMSDALLKMDTRPYEQKELDSLLTDMNTYMYLLKNAIINDLNNKRNISMNQKIVLYNNLFKDNKYMANEANATYVKNKSTPNYSVDTNLDKKVETYLTSATNLSTQMTTIYDNIFKNIDVDKNKELLLKLNIPMPTNLSGEDEENIIDPLTILREFADNINNMYDSLNTIIAPYYNYVFELAIAPYPVQDAGSTTNREGDALISSFVREMLSFSSSYNGAMINYAMNENVYTSLVKSKDYKNNLLKLPHLSQDSINNINDLYARNVINDTQISSFDKTVQDVTNVYNYFMALYYIIKANPDPAQIDVDSIDKILKGTLVFNSKDKYILQKKYDPTPDNDEYTYVLKNVITPTIEYIFVSPVVGFTTEKSIPAGPSKDAVNKAKQNLASQISKALTNVGNTIAKGTTQAANTVAKGTTQAANTVAKGTTQTAKSVGKSIKKLF